MAGGKRAKTKGGSLAPQLYIDDRALGKRRKEVGVKPKKMRGEVTSITPQGGFGFLLGEDGTERFFHVTMLLDPALEMDDIKVGAQVRFVPILSAKGPRASAVELLDEDVNGNR